MKFVVLVMYIFTVLSPIKSEPSICGVDESNTFLHDLRFQCPKAISLSFPLQVIRLIFFFHFFGYLFIYLY